MPHLASLSPLSEAPFADSRAVLVSKFPSSNIGMNESFLGSWLPPPFRDRTPTVHGFGRLRVLAVLQAALHDLLFREQFRSTGAR